MTDYDGFRVEHEGDVARITLDVPGKLNRVSMLARDQLRALFEELDHRRIEADGDRAGNLDDEARSRRRAAPAFTRPVAMPRPVHPQMGT